MPLLYDGKKLIPAPFVQLRKDSVVSGTEKTGNTVSIVLKGKLVAYKGSPDKTGAFWTAAGYPPDDTVADSARLASILKKQQALQQLFNTDGRTLEIQPFNASAPVKFNPRIKSVEFAEGNWYDVCDYTVTMEAEDPNDANASIVSEASEEWNIEPADDKGVSYRLTHSVTATGKKTYDETGTATDAWVNARTYVLQTIGLGLVPARLEAPGVLDADALQAFNYVRTQHVNEYTGNFQVTETWLCYDPQDEPPAIDEYTVTTRVAENGLVTVSVEGQVQGLEVRNNNTRALESTRYANAEAKFTTHVAPSLYARCQTISGITLNPIETSSSVGRNPATGVVTYSREYNNRPLSAVLGAISDTITVTDDHPADVFAAIPVLGRAAGPVLQDIGTVTVRKRSISIEVVMPCLTLTYTPTQPSTNLLVAALMPVANQVFTDQDRETWSPKTGRYSRETSFTWQ